MSCNTDSNAKVKNLLSAFPNISIVKTSIRTFLNLEAKMRLSQKNRTFESLINALTFPNPPCFNNTICRAGHVSYFFVASPRHAVTPTRDRAVFLSFSCVIANLCHASCLFKRVRRKAPVPRRRSSSTLSCSHPPPFVAVILHPSWRSCSTLPCGHHPPLLVVIFHPPSFLRSTSPLPLMADHLTHGGQPPPHTTNLL